MDLKKNNNNNAQPAADSATPVAAAANDTSSNSPNPLKSFTPKDLLAHNHDMNELVERTSSLVSTVIAERLNQLKSNNNE